MTPNEYGAFYQTFPTVEAWTRDLPSALDPALGWARRHPDLAAKEPAATRLVVMRRAAGAR